MIYFIRSSDGIKIGLAVRPENRIADLQTAAAKRFDVLGVMPGQRGTDQEIRRRFRKHHIRGDWFEPADAILNFIKRKCRPLQPSSPKPYRLSEMTTISFRGSQLLKGRVALLQSTLALHGRGQSFNDWLDRQITAELQTLRPSTPDAATLDSAPPELVQVMDAE